MPGDRETVLAQSVPAHADHVLTDAALSFLAALHREFEPQRRRLLRERETAQQAIDAGELPTKRADTHAIRHQPWQIPAVPADLQDRRVEITGPTTRRTMVDAFNSGANVYKADFEDTNAPTWHNMVDGQVNLAAAVRGTLTAPGDDGHDRVTAQPATLVVRPRGLHLPEPNVRVDGQPLAGALMDFGLFFFHNAVEQVTRGTGPYFYLPKLEHAREAAFWTEVFRFAQDWVGLDRGTVKATALIEHVLAALQTDEILYELAEHAAGLNAGRWDYIFSLVKTFREHPDRVLPDRDLVTMRVPFMRAYTDRVVATCHRRGAHAIGGMSALIPDPDQPEATRRALDDVRADKHREARAGFDGAWVAHPDLVDVVAEVFADHLGDQPHQIAHQRDDVTAGADELLALDVPDGAITTCGLDTNLRAALHYLSAWLAGRGAVDLDGKLEDTATAEISRSQVWQWQRHRVATADGDPVTPQLVHQQCAATAARVSAEQAGQPELQRQLPRARRLLDEVTAAERLPDFVTEVGLAYLDGGS